MININYCNYCKRLLEIARNIIFSVQAFVKVSHFSFYVILSIMDKWLKTMSFKRTVGKHLLQMRTPNKSSGIMRNTYCDNLSSKMYTGKRINGCWLHGFCIRKAGYLLFLALSLAHVLHLDSILAF